MYRVLIADDKAIERNYLKNFLNTYYSDIFLIVCGAQDGREAIDYVSANSVDLALLDIEMPKIDGIEVAQQIRRTHPEIEILLITAYAEFSYAKQAIKIGVTDYLLKPYIDEELKDILDNIVIKLGQQKNIEKYGEDEGKQIDTRYFELKITMNKILLDHNRREFGKEAFVNQPFNHSDFKTIVLFEEKLANISLDTLQLLIGIFRKRNLYVLGYSDGAEVIIYLFGDRKIDFFEVDACIKKSMNLLNDENYGQVLCGVSGFYDSLASMYTSYIEATSFITEFGSAKVQEAFQENISDRKTRYELMLKLLTNIIMKNKGETADNIECMYSHVEKNITFFTAYIAYYLISNVYATLGHNEDKNTVIESLGRQIANNKNDLELNKALLYTLTDELIKKVGELTVYNNVILTDRAKEYIYKHYTEKISLQDVSQALEVSYGYLSKCFKQVEKTTFNRFLLETRIEKAKEIMQLEDTTVSEIAYQVGIEDPNYFSKCFKRATGESPKDYRTRLIIENKSEE